MHSPRTKCVHYAARFYPAHRPRFQRTGSSNTPSPCHYHSPHQQRQCVFPPLLRRHTPLASANRSLLPHFNAPFRHTRRSKGRGSTRMLQQDPITSDKQPPPTKGRHAQPRDGMNTGFVIQEPRDPRHPSAFPEQANCAKAGIVDPKRVTCAVYVSFSRSMGHIPPPGVKEGKAHPLKEGRSPVVCGQDHGAARVAQVL